MTDNAAEVGLQETAETWLREHKKAWSGHDLYSLIRLLEARSQTICDYVSAFGDSTKCGRKKGHEGLHMMEPIVPPKVVEKGIVDNEDRAFFDRHYWQIAKRLHDKRLWRGPWSIEVNGCVYKFTVTGYAKKGSEVWKEQEKEQQLSEKRESPA